jgi:hypothetical protein
MVTVEITHYEAYEPQYLDFETEEQALAFISRLEYCLGRTVANKKEKRNEV